MDTGKRRRLFRHQTDKGGFLARAGHQRLQLLYALQVVRGLLVRRHRLLETFLVRTLGYTWDEVHEEAEMLEHATSDRFVERIDAFLGAPARDPHGDPIPDAQGSIEDLGTLTLDDVPLHTPVTIERVCDGDTELLRYLDSHGVGLGVEVVVDSRVAGLLNLHAGDEEFSLAEVAAADVTVRANEV